MLMKVGFERGAVVRQFTVRPIMIAVLQLCDPAHHVCLEIAMETGFGHPTQPQDLGIGHALTAQVEGFQPHLHPWVRMLKPPMPQRADVLFVEDDFDHRRAPRHRLHRKRIPRRRRLEHKVSIKFH
jgi:hypothetical protein